MIYSLISSIVLMISGAQISQPNNADVVSLEMQKAKIDQVIEQLSKQLNASFIINSDVISEQQVDIKFDNIPTPKAIEKISDLFNVTFEVNRKIKSKPILIVKYRSKLKPYVSRLQAENEISDFLKQEQATISGDPEDGDKVASLHNEVAHDLSAIAREHLHEINSLASIDKFNNKEKQLMLKAIHIASWQRIVQKYRELYKLLGTSSTKSKE